MKRLFVLLFIVLLCPGISKAYSLEAKSCFRPQNSGYSSVSIVTIGEIKNIYSLDIDQDIRNESHDANVLCYEINKAVVKREANDVSEIYKISSKNSLGLAAHLTNINYSYLIHYGVPLRIPSSVSPGQRYSFKVGFRGGDVDFRVNVSKVEKMEMFGRQVALVRYSLSGFGVAGDESPQGRYIGAGYDYVNVESEQRFLRFFEIKSYDDKKNENFSLQYAESSLFEGSML